MNKVICLKTYDPRRKIMMKPIQNEKAKYGRDCLSSRTRRGLLYWSTLLPSKSEMTNGINTYETNGDRAEGANSTKVYNG
jgi:hypothetical protein